MKGLRSIFVAMLLGAGLLAQSAHAATLVSLDFVGDTVNLHREFKHWTAFKDVYELTVAEPGFPIRIEGSHDNMLFKRLLVIDVDNLVGDRDTLFRNSYLLGETFSADIAAVDPGTYKIKLIGKAKPHGFYDVNLTAVPLPAAAWLFLSGLGILGYVGWRKHND